MHKDRQTLLKISAGRGAYGRVYKALDRSTNQHVAIKIMSLSESEEEDLARIQKEIDLLAGEQPHTDCSHEQKDGQGLCRSQ
jgi:serine/threonine protein kinase